MFASRFRGSGMSVARDGPIPLCGCAFLSVQNSCCAMLVCWALLLFGCFFGRRYLPIPLTLLTVALQLKTLLTYVLAVLLSSKLPAVDCCEGVFQCCSFFTSSPRLWLRRRRDAVTLRSTVCALAAQLHCREKYTLVNPVSNSLVSETWVVVPGTMTGGNRIRRAGVSRECQGLP